MAQRLLPQTLIELYAHSLAIEREAFKRFIELERYMRDCGLDYIAEEFEKIGREEQEQYEALALGTCERQLPPIADWEYAWHYLGSSVVGWLCGFLWEHGGWGGVVMLLGSLLAAALLISLRLRSLAPLGPALVPA